MTKDADEIEKIVQIERAIMKVASEAGKDIAALGNTIGQIYYRSHVVSRASGSFEVRITLSPYTPPDITGDDDGED